MTLKQKEELKEVTASLAGSSIDLMYSMMQFGEALRELRVAYKKAIARQKEIKNLKIKKYTLGLTYNELKRLNG